MSCFKCGRDLPPGEVECPDGCTLNPGDGSQKSAGGNGQPGAGLPPFMILHVEFKLDYSKMSTRRS